MSGAGVCKHWVWMRTQQTGNTQTLIMRGRGSGESILSRPPDRCRFLPWKIRVKVDCPQRSKAAKLRVGRICRGRAFWRRVELVGAEAGAGEEAQACPFAELGEHVAGFDAEEDGEFVAAPVTRGMAGDDRSDPLPASGRHGRAGTGRGGPRAAATARACGRRGGGGAVRV